MKKSIRKIIQKHERGQVIVLVAFAIVGLVAMLGLVTDTGLLLIEYGNLKRGVDAGAIAAAQQYSLPSDQLTQQSFIDAATNFLNLNQTRGLTSISVHSCLLTDPARPLRCNQDPAGHPENNRKLVEVTATSNVKFYFLSVIGIRSTTITANSIGEAATLDIVLVMDTSASMAYETRPDPIKNSDADSSNPFRYDPSAAGLVSENPRDCNFSLAQPCQPMDGVRRAALAFTNTLNFGYDRVGIVALTGQAANANSAVTRHPVQVLALSSDKNLVQNAITNIKVYQPPVCDDALTASSPIFNSPTDPGSCIKYVNSQFSSVICQSIELQFITGTYNYAPCPSSNVGGALRIAGATLSGTNRRLDSFWVVMVLLTSGATSTDTPQNYPATSYPDGVPAAFPYGYCPANEYYPSNGHTLDVYPYKFCTDGAPSVRHAYTATTTFTYNNNTTAGMSIYDPDDYARDRADALANMLSGTGVTIYTIGLGVEVQNTDKLAPGEPKALAEDLLDYIATRAGRSTVNHGQYFYSPTYSQLTVIFERIAENIATKISQ